jgi:hypothetical protein
MPMDYKRKRKATTMTESTRNLLLRNGFDIGPSGGGCIGPRCLRKQERHLIAVSKRNSEERDKRMTEQCRKLDDKINRWNAELESVSASVTFRWGETRRFHSNTNKIKRINWLIDHIAEASCKLKRLQAKEEREN